MCRRRAGPVACNLQAQWAPELLEVEFRVESDADLATVAECGVWASMLRSPEQVQAGGNVAARLWSDVPYRIDLIPVGAACGAIEHARDVVESGVTLVLAMDGDRLTCTVD